MANETVQAIKAAELSAVQTEKDAVIRKEAILSDAQQNTKNLIASMTKKAQEKALLNIKEAEKEGEKIMEAAKLKAESQINDLNKNAKGREQAAIDLVLSIVI